jgi:hypothetical protein
MQVFEKILRHSLSHRDHEDDELAIDTLNNELTSVFEALPEQLCPKPMTESVVDSPATIVTRLCVSFLYNKCICVLHRPYVVRGRAASVAACHDAASSIVRDFIDVYYQIAPGGQLESERWFLSSLTWYDVLLGGTVLCLLLWAELRGRWHLLHDKTPMLDLLDKIQHIITQQQEAKTSETIKVLRIVQSTLRQFRVDELSNSMSFVEGKQEGGDASADTAMPEVFDDLATQGLNDTFWGDLERLINTDYSIPGLETASNGLVD